MYLEIQRQRQRQRQMKTHIHTIKASKTTSTTSTSTTTTTLPTGREEETVIDHVRCPVYRTAPNKIDKLFLHFTDTPGMKLCRCMSYIYIYICPGSSFPYYIFFLSLSHFLPRIVIVIVIEIVIVMMK